MTTSERPFQHYSREDLEAVLELIPKEKVKYALICKKVQDSRKENPQLLFEKTYREYFEKRQKGLRGTDLPPHKIAWCMEAIDGIGRALKFAPDGELYPPEIEEVLRLTGLYDKKFVDPKVQRQFDNPKNWNNEPDYFNKTHGTFIGPSDVARLVREHSRFDRMDLHFVLGIMETYGHLTRGKATLTLRLSGKE